MGRQWRISGDSDTRLAVFDAVMQAFMRERDISCGSLAVACGGRLVLARGYTWSDNTSLVVQPTSLFRIASLSKPITAAAVLRLVQDGKLALSDRIVDVLTLQPLPGHIVDERLADVTIQRLLQHLGGWDSEAPGGFEPILHDAAIAEALQIPLPISQEDIIRYTTSMPLNHNPGSVYAYSNYGYLLLGRVIEQITGMDCGSYVQEHILEPCGVTRMVLGSGRNQHPDEVPYFSTETGPTVYDNTGTIVPAPYGVFHVENMDGWLGSAVDVVRWASIFDGTTSVLSPAAITMAFAEPEIGMDDSGCFYGCGWMVRPEPTGFTTWHTGRLPGTYAQLVRRHDGLTWAVLFNQRDDPRDPGRDHDNGIDHHLHQVANSITTWPTGDLYHLYIA